MCSLSTLPTFILNVTLEGKMHWSYIGGLKGQETGPSHPTHQCGKVTCRNSLSGPSVEEHHLVERKCLIEGVPPVRHQITEVYPDKMYLSLSALERRRVRSLHGEKGHTPTFILGLSYSYMQNVYGVSEPQILKLC
jgi:hypothetical protein